MENRIKRRRAGRKRYLVFHEKTAKSDGATRRPQKLKKRRKPPKNDKTAKKSRYDADLPEITRFRASRIDQPRATHDDEDVEKCPKTVKTTKKDHKGPTPSPTPPGICMWTFYRAFSRTFGRHLLNAKRVQSRAFSFL
jgi:hypothetical protein